MVASAALLSPAGQIKIRKSKQTYGPCDPEMVDSPYGLMPLRYDVGLFKLTVAAGVATIDAGEKIELFTTGEDETSEASGWPAGVKKSSGEVSAYEKGALAQKDGNFEIEGAAMAIERPFILDEEGRACTPPWLDEYEQRIRDQFLTRTFVEFMHGKQKCDWLIGPPSFFPTYGGPTGPVVSNGANAAMGMYVALRTSDLSGPVDDPSKIKAIWQVGSLGLCFPEFEGLEITSDIYVPARLALHGRPECGPCKPVCAPEGVADDVIQAAILKAIEGLSPTDLARILAARMGNK